MNRWRSALFTHEEIVELTLTASYYIAAAHFLEVLAIDLEHEGFDDGVKINERPQEPPAD